MDCVPRTMLEKIWHQHEVIPESADTPAVLYIDLHLIHEVTSPQAFAVLGERGLSVRRPELTLATLDHSTPTRTEQIFGGAPIAIESAARQIRALERNCALYGVELLGLKSEQRGIVHVIGPELGANLLITCFGLGLLLLWRGGGGRDILLCSALLLLYAPIAIVFSLQDTGVLHIPWALYILLFHLIELPQMAVNIEFTWTTHALRNRLWKRVAQIALIVFNATFVIRALDPHPSLLVAWSIPAGLICVCAFDAIAFAANLWALLVQRRNKLIAASLALIPLAAFLLRFNILDHFTLGPFTIDAFNFAFLLSALALFIMLGRRAWGSWREGNQLRAEFDAAREVQERLVIPPPEIPGFRMERAYIPATQVGGDFYHIRADDHGGVQIAIGDVSGKGLRAAMAVSAIVGALRAMPMLPPSRILSDLNRGLTGNLGGGFVTCCVTHIAADGKMTIANAGHLSPYRNGVELDAGSGLPLGITLNTTFDEHAIHLNPGDTLTFLSDGVVEARSPHGQLYGFDRTQIISNQSARAIADAAKSWGQEDDITVLTLFFAGSAAARA